MARELARLEVSPLRRNIGVGVQGGLGMFLLIVVALQPATNLGGTLILAAVGFFMLWFAWRFWKATAGALILTTEGLFDHNGRHFFDFKDIEKVDRGFFAFRPSSGFLILLKEPGARGWAPGMWWAFGKHLGIGGAIGRPAGKQFADIISVMLTERGDEIKAEKH